MIKWILPKWVVLLSFLYYLLIALLGLLWFFVEVNIPFFNTGDKWIVYVFIFLWWLASTLLIFGWKIKKD